MKIHPVFHGSLLDQFIESNIPGPVQPPPPPVEIDDHIEYEVEEVLDSKSRENSYFT
jgi:hypothetical protein